MRNLQKNRFLGIKCFEPILLCNMTASKTHGSFSISDCPPKNTAENDTFSAVFFIQVADLVYHRRAKRGAYHQPLWGCISSRASVHLPAA